MRGYTFAGLMHGVQMHRRIADRVISRFGVLPSKVWYGFRGSHHRGIERARRDGDITQVQADQLKAVMRLPGE